MIDSYFQKRICNEICKKYRVKKPAGGIGRYESGQALCLTCSIWIDHNGCLLKDGSPATENSLGWTCKCCNYRVRQKPRNLVYKDKLRNSLLESDSDTRLSNEIAKKAEKLEQKIKKLKMELEQKISSIQKKKKIKKIVNKILKSTISLTPCPSCNLTPNNQMEAIRLFGLRYNGTRRQSYCYKCRGSKTQIKLGKNDEPRNKSINRNQIPESKIQYSLNSEEGIRLLTEKMVTEHILNKKLINNQLRKILTAEFVEVRSLSTMFKMHPELSEEQIVRHIITDLRLPSELKKLENEGVLHSNLECSLKIALFATNYFDWNGEKDKENDVVNLALSLSKYLKADTELNQKFKGELNFKQEQVLFQKMREERMKSKNENLSSKFEITRSLAAYKAHRTRMLNNPKKYGNVTEELIKNIKRLEEKLLNFGKP